MADDGLGEREGDVAARGKLYRETLEALEIVLMPSRTTLKYRLVWIVVSSEGELMNARPAQTIPARTIWGDLRQNAKSPS